MKKNNLILGALLAITAILFSSCGASSSSDSTSTEKVEGSTESTNAWTNLESFGVVTIGKQVWTSKNLNVETYRNGDVIPEVQDQKAWANLTTGAWCYYNNDKSNGTKYGKLYNYYAVNDPRGLAPKGYHIPQVYEFRILDFYLDGYNRQAGIKMKSTSGWNISKVFEATNSSGFAGLPGGCRWIDGFVGVGNYMFGEWWCSGNERGNLSGCKLTHESDHLEFSPRVDPIFGCSVRCLRD